MHLETLGYATEKRQKVVRLCLPFRRLEDSSDDCKTLSVNPAVNRYLVRIRKGWGSERRGMGSVIHLLFPRYSGPLTPLPLRLLGYGKPLPFYMHLGSS